MIDETSTTVAEAAAKVPVASDSVPSNASTPEPVVAESKPVSEGSEQDNPTPDKAEDAKPKKSASGRIAELVAQRKQAEADASAAKAEAIRVREELVELRRQQASPDIPYEQAEELRLQKAVKSERAEQLASEANRKQAEAERRQVELFYEKVDAVRDRMPDFDQVFSNVHRTLPPTMADLIVESEFAPQIAYHLGKNPTEWERIAHLPPHRQGAEIARIEAKLSLPIRKTSNAPPPPPSVSGAKATAAKSPQEMSAAEYIAHRKKEWAKAGR